MEKIPLSPEMNDERKRWQPLIDHYNNPPKPPKQGGGCLGILIAVAAAVAFFVF